MSRALKFRQEVRPFSNQQKKTVPSASANFVESTLRFIDFYSLSSCWLVPACLSHTLEIKSMSAIYLHPSERCLKNYLFLHCAALEVLPNFGYVDLIAKLGSPNVTQGGIPLRETLFTNKVWFVCRVELFVCVCFEVRAPSFWCHSDLTYRIQ